MTKIGVCVPTYQKPELIQDLIDNELEFYCNLCFDLYIFDSSIDDKTKCIVASYQKKFSNLFYIRMPSSLHANKKVYQIFQMAGQGIIRCEYLWIRSDAMLCHKKFLKELGNYLDYDIIVTAAQGGDKKGIWEVNNYQRFFEEYAWQVCLFGAVILNVSRMVKKADWTFLSKKYLAIEHINFSHVCFYFEQIMKLGDCKILVFDLPELLYHGNYKKKFSSWFKDFFELWLKRWPDTINVLPDYYKNKTYAIRQLGNEKDFSGIFSFSYLTCLVEGNILTANVLEKYKKRIQQYAGVDIEYFEAALNFSPETANVVYCTEEYKHLLSFVRRFSVIVVYGCGKRAISYIRFLRYKNINFDKIVVTRKNGAESSYMGYDIVERDDYKFTARTGVILAMKPAFQMEVSPFFKQKKLYHNLFCWPEDTMSYYIGFLKALKEHKILNSNCCGKLKL